MGNILGKPKNKLKNFLDNSKKLVQVPKELPDLGERRGGEQSLPQVPQRPRMSASGSSVSQLQNQAQVPREIKPPELQPPIPKKDLRLPKIEHPGLGSISQQPQPSQPAQPIYYQQKPVKAHDEDLKRFEEAISNINIDMIHSETPTDSYAHSGAGEGREDYYKPAMGEGYFSEIEHYIKNKDVNEIINDVLKKDFLAGMKDYHDTKAQGKPFFFNKDDLKNKLKIKMDALRRLEEEWHIRRTQIAEEEKKRVIVEREIDQQSQEMKELFKQIKLNQWLEHEAPREHYFRLINGQELKSLNDLRKALAYMNEYEFSHHVNNEKNDFATWVKEALQNPELYEKIKNINTREQLLAKLQNPL